MSPYLSIDQAAAHLGISPRMFVTRVKPRLPPRSLVRGASVYRVRDLDAFAKMHLVLPGFSRSDPLEPGTPTVYFVRAGRGLIKIGYTSQIESRMAGLQASCPVKLTMVASAPGTRRDERLLHEQFASLRTHGEWFRPGPELLTLVRDIRRSGQL